MRCLRRDREFGHEASVTMTRKEEDEATQTLLDEVMPLQGGLEYSISPNDLSL